MDFRYFVNVKVKRKKETGMIYSIKSYLVRETVCIGKVSIRNASFEVRSVGWDNKFCRQGWKWGGGVNREKAVSLTLTFSKYADMRVMT